MNRWARSCRGAGAGRRGLVLGLALAVAVGGFSCASTQFKSTWTNPTAQPVALNGQKVAAFMITPIESARLSGEDILAGELTARGAYGIPGYKLTGKTEVKDSEILRKKLGEIGIDGIVIMRVVDRRQEVTYIPGGPLYGSPWGYWDYGYAMMAAPGYLATDTIVSVETLVYNVKDDKLLWGGVSETIDPVNLDSFVRSIAKQAGKEMTKAGVLQT